MVLNFRAFKNFDWLLFIPAILLFLIGVAIIYSTTYGIEESGKEAFQQGIFGLVSIVAFFVVSFIDYRTFRSVSGVLYLVSVLALLGVLISGYATHGATRWIDLGFFKFQPSEFAKLFMIVAMAKFFAERAGQMQSLKNIFVSGLYFLIPAVLVAMQPDLGTALVFFVIWIAMILVSGISKKHLLILATGALLLVPTAWYFMQDYQKERVTSFFSQNEDLEGQGYNVRQAQIAIGSGQFLGRGLGHGPQSQLNFIPEKHTDFIFAALAEETGFVGAFLVISLFGILILRGLYIAASARDHYGMYLATGIIAMITFHIFLNIGMNIGMAPVTGLPLPLISLGGSSIVVTFLLLGFLESVHIKRKKIDF